MWRRCLGLDPQLNFEIPPTVLDRLTILGFLLVLNKFVVSICIIVWI